VNRRLFFNNAPLRVVAIGFGMAFDKINALDDRPAPVRKHSQDPSFLTLVLPVQDLY
jgi:hypothetical protein